MENSQNTEAETCSVCLNDIKKAELLDGCDHIFCYSCANQWRDEQIRSKKPASCPTCRVPFSASSFVKDMAPSIAIPLSAINSSDSPSISNKTSPLGSPRASAPVQPTSSSPSKVHPWMKANAPSAPIQPLECNHCNRGFLDRTSLSEHVAFDHGNLRCPQCNALFVSLIALERHVLGHLKCQECFQVFNTLGEKIKHQETRHGLPCASFNLFFPTHSLLEAHKKTHANRSNPIQPQVEVKPAIHPIFQCQYKCPDRFTSQAQVEAHNDLVHPFCTPCQPRFKTPTSLYQHSKAVHKEGASQQLKTSTKTTTPGQSVVSIIAVNPTTPTINPVLINEPATTKSNAEISWIDLESWKKSGCTKVLEHLLDLAKLKIEAGLSDADIKRTPCSYCGRPHFV